MHQYVTGHWAGSTYSSKGDRTDHLLSLSPDGSFIWRTESLRKYGTDREESVGVWTHDGEQDVLTLTSTSGEGTTTSVQWSIHYVTGCEDSNCILVLRWLSLASRNLPIFLERIHPPEDPVWQARPRE